MDSVSRSALCGLLAMCNVLTGMACDSQDIRGMREAEAPLPNPSQAQTQALALEQVTPALGPSVGGTPISIFGQGFAVGASVQIGGQPAEEVTVWSGTKITAKLPTQLGAIGPATVMVTNPDGQSVSRSNLFSYHLGQLPFGSLDLFSGNYSVHLTTADWNQDGQIDIAAAQNRSPYGVSLFLSNGAGGYERPVQFGFSTAGTDLLTTADLDGDQRPEIIVVSSPNVSVYQYEEHGSFVAKSSSRPAAGIRQLVSGDWNGDDQTDLLFATATGTTLGLLTGDGQGRFSLPVYTELGATVSALAVGDWNRDGKLDVAAAHGATGNVSLLLGDGRGALALGKQLAVGSNPSALAAGDVNNDAAPDLVVANQGDDRLAILLGDGGGDFVLSHVPAGGLRPVSVVMADWDNDGKLDLAVASDGATTTQGGVTTLLGDGAGGFGGTTRYVANDSSQLVVADFNRDNRPDIASLGQGARLLLNNGSGRLGIQMEAFGGSTNAEMVVGDFNGDRRTDMATSSAMYLQNDQGRLIFSYTTVLFNTPLSIASIYTESGFRFSGIALQGKVYFADSSGNLSQRIGSGILPSSFQATAGGHFNHDSAVDVAAVSGGTFASACLINGTQTQHSQTIPPDEFKRSVVGDFDGDGNLDVSFASSSKIYIFWGQGDCSFTNPQILSNVGLSSITGLIAVDLNGDRISDLAVSSYSGNYIAIGRADRGFSAIRMLDDIQYSSCVGSGDFDGNNTQDLFFAGELGHLYWGDGRGGFSSVSSFYYNGMPYACAVGDFNGDRKIDIILSQLSGSSMIYNRSH